MHTHRAEEDVGSEADGLDGRRLQRDLHQPAELSAERLDPAQVEEDGRAAADVHHQRHHLTTQVHGFRRHKHQRYRNNNHQQSLSLMVFELKTRIV